MSQSFDASRSLTALEQDNTLIAVIEMSQSKWLVAAIVPGLAVEWARRPGVSPPMRMSASWFRSVRINRIQACGALSRLMASSPRDLPLFARLQERFV
jgi:hypothetical protein